MVLGGFRLRLSKEEEEAGYGWDDLFLFDCFCSRLSSPTGAKRMLSNSPQVLRSSVPNYLFHRYSLWLSRRGNHGTDVFVRPRAGSGLLMPGSSGHSRSRDSRRELQSHDRSRDAVGEDASRRGGASMGGGGRKSLSQGGEGDLEASQDAEG